MESLIHTLETIPTNSCQDREDAKRDLSSGISMKSAIVIEEFMKTWVLTSESELAKMSSEDKAYRQFILEFQEIYDGRD